MFLKKWKYNGKEKKIVIRHIINDLESPDFFFVSGISSQTFTINRTAAEVGGNFFKPSVPLPPTLQTLRL